MNHRIVLATHNQGKVREFRALLAAQPQLQGLSGFDPAAAVVDAATAGCSDVPETGVTFRTGGGGR